MGNPGSVLMDRFARASGWISSLLMVLTGAGIALGQAPFELSVLAFLSVILAIFLGLATANPRQALLRGWLIGFGFSAVAFFWIVEPFMVDIASHGWMAPFALGLMASGNGTFWAAAFWGAKRLGGGHVGRTLLSLAVMLTAAELLRSYVFTGFPWALSAYIWVDTPIYQLASIFGPHGLNLATFGLAAMFVWAGLFGGGVVLLVCMATTAFAGVVASQNWNAKVAETAQFTGQPVLRLIQPNAQQHEKWDPDMIPVFFERQLEMSGKSAAKQPDLVIWPEVAVAFFMNDPYAPLGEISAAARGAPVILGAQRLGDRRAFNSLALIDNGGEVAAIYDKHHLVPFGEYLPGGEFLARVGLKAMTAKYGIGYSAGAGPDVLDLGELGMMMPLICYEVIFPHEMRRVGKRPDWMLNLTNDAWFGELQGPYQHLAQSRARAIEFGIPMVRVANTGVSAVIGTNGRIIRSLPLGVAGYLDVPLPKPLAPTVYWKTGDIPAILMIIVLLLGLFLASRRKGLTQT